MAEAGCRLHGPVEVVDGGFVVFLLEVTEAEHVVEVGAFVVQGGALAKNGDRLVVFANILQAVAHVGVDVGDVFLFRIEAQGLFKVAVEYSS